MTDIADIDVQFGQLAGSRGAGPDWLMLDADLEVPSDRFADVSYRLPRQTLYVRQFSIGGRVTPGAQPARQLGFDGDER